MEFKRRVALALIVTLGWWCINAQTLINLASQVQGILALANGGTGVSSTTISAHNYFGNNTSSTGAPGYVRPNCADLSDSGTGCTSAALNFSDNETPTGTCNSSNQSFTLAHSPSPTASLSLYLNGQLLISGGNDYTLSGTTVTSVFTCSSGDVLKASYRY